MLDNHGREIDYIRISLTDRCNLRCKYCMPEEGVCSLPHEELLTYEEILELCSVLAELGFRKVKLTGGEPLVRQGCPQLIAQMKAIPGIEKVTLTTNGVLLKEQMAELAAAGLDAVNISLDTVNPQTFQDITRRDQLSQVLAGIEAALDYAPQIPVKLNCVPLSTNPQELIDLAGLAQRYPLYVRFIEMMPIGYGKDFPFQKERKLIAMLEEAYGRFTPSPNHYGNGPCHYFDVPHFQGKLGFISAITHKFCDQCNKLRLTPEGYLKACLQYQIGGDLKSILRQGCSRDQLKTAIIAVIQNKPLSHNFHEIHNTQEDEGRSMSQIGG